MTRRPVNPSAASDMSHRIGGPISSGCTSFLRSGKASVLMRATFATPPGRIALTVTPVPFELLRPCRSCNLETGFCGAVRREAGTVHGVIARLVVDDSAPAAFQELRHYGPGHTKCSV